jgi:hypothetical protein
MNLSLEEWKSLVQVMQWEAWDIIKVVGDSWPRETVFSLEPGARSTDRKMGGSQSLTLCNSDFCL